jgi:hypothetical protein
MLMLIASIANAQTFVVEYIDNRDGQHYRIKVDANSQSEAQEFIEDIVPGCSIVACWAD